ncbi:MAG: hypothetical protein Q7T11_02700 [Deltaproteobacteria bacterium]|nr:hypothetical protein [Deltaproteobacteria bacterium]
MPAMVGIILISENREAAEMLKTARRLVGRMKGITSLMMKPGTPPTRMRNNLKKALEHVDSHQGVILLTDFYGSTQCNTCMKFLREGEVELLTGFSLPMLVKLGTLNASMPFGELVTFIEQYGRDHIQRVASRKKRLKKRGSK